MTKIALVTGGNKGIGYEVCKLLAHRHRWRVILTARDETRGKQAASSLGVEFCQLDVTDSTSISRAASYVQQHCGGSIDVLINNAGFAAQGTSGLKEAQYTIAINTIGLRNVTDALLPYIKDRIVNVSSRVGSLRQVSASLQSRFTSPSLTPDGVIQLMNEYISSVESGKPSGWPRHSGWPTPCYSVSKIGVIALSNVYARQLNGRISVFSCCPGYCQTDMTSHHGSVSAEQGADTIVWLAAMMSPAEAQAGNGKFFAERSAIRW